jgi:DNA-binding transcriptional MocR family regulator
MDNKQIVIYLGTFSKVLFPGLRIGWVAAEKQCIQRLLALKRFSDLTSSFILQAAVDEFCREGHYDLHIRHMHRIFRRRMQTALKSLKTHLKDPRVSWSEPSGGYLIWLHLKGTPHEESQLLDIFVKNGVLISPGRYYFYNRQEGNYFRLSISTLDEREIQEGIKRLGTAIKQIYG